MWATRLFACRAAIRSGRTQWSYGRALTKPKLKRKQMYRWSYPSQRYTAPQTLMGAQYKLVRGGAKGWPLDCEGFCGIGGSSGSIRTAGQRPASQWVSQPPASSSSRPCQPGATQPESQSAGSQQDSQQTVSRHCTMQN